MFYSHECTLLHWDALFEYDLPPLRYGHCVDCSRSLLPILQGDSVYQELVETLNLQMDSENVVFMLTRFTVTKASYVERP